MKKIINKFKHNKTLYILIIILLITFILGCLFIAFLSDENKQLILTSLNSFIDTIKTNKQSSINTLYRSISNNLIISTLVWIIGISIIGIPLIILILGIKSFVLGFTITSFIYNFKLKGIIWGIIYILPHIINLLLLFILSYYAINFSKMIFNYYFRKKEYSKNVIVKRYIKILVVCIVIYSLSSLIEAYVIPNIFKILI